MMIGMSLQVIQDQICVFVIAVPRVMGLASFVLSTRLFLTQQAIMLNVVRAGQLPPGQKIVNGQKGNHHPAKCRDEGNLQGKSHRVGL